MPRDDAPPPTTAEAPSAASEGHGGDGDDNAEDATEILAHLAASSGGRRGGGGGATQVSEAQQAALAQMMAQLQAGGGGGGPRTAEEGGRRPHAFWDTQPMLVAEAEHKHGKKSKASGRAKAPSAAGPAAADPGWHRPILPDRDPADLRPEPYNMPRGFAWSEVDVADPDQRAEIYDLLYQNYVEDDECMFRFDYSRDFLIWALTPPGHRQEFRLGVRSTKSGRLMALITGVPARVRVYDEERDMVEVNFLCVHKKLRSKRLAPVLIKEITRRVNRAGTFQAVYTAGVVLPGHVARCRYHHRTLDAKKLVEVGFTRLPPRMTLARMIKLHRLPPAPAAAGLRPLTPADVPAARDLVANYLKRFRLAPVFSEEEFAHWLLPREGVVSSFVVVRQGADGAETITDFISYYHLHSSVLGNPKHSTLRAAYAFYNVATSMDLTELMRDALILAKNEGMDVFNALDLMDNDEFLEALKFGRGDGNLQYYVYNWSCPAMEHGDVGLVLL